MAAFVVLSVAIMVVDSRYDHLDRLRFGLAYLGTPVYWIADIPARTSNWIDDVFVSQRDLIEENERLRQELLFARRELQLLESLASENERLRALQEASLDIEGRVMTAEIINVASDTGSRRVMINKGAHNGVEAGQALLDANGLMGQVTEVLPFTSWVMLITDSRHGTPVQVNRNGERAIVRGSVSASSLLELEFVPDTADIQVGDLLVSSGLGQRFPKGYPVARVSSVEHDPGQAFAIIRARPVAELDRTRHVMLVEPPDTGPSDASFQTISEAAAAINAGPEALEERLEEEAGSSASAREQADAPDSSPEED